MYSSEYIANKLLIKISLQVVLWSQVNQALMNWTLLEVLPMEKKVVVRKFLKETPIELVEHFYARTYLVSVVAQNWFGSQQLCSNQPSVEIVVRSKNSLFQ